MTFNINHKTILIAVVLLVGTFALISSVPGNAEGRYLNDAKKGKGSKAVSKAIGGSPGKISMEEFHRQRQKISGLNLLNGLYLTEEQMEQIIPLARETRESEEQALEKLIEINSDTDFIAALEEHVATLLKGNQPEGELKQTLNRFHGQEVEIGYGLEKKKQELGLKAIDVFSKEQMALIAEFKPCLIAPQDENSTLTGSAAGGLHVHNALKKMRRIPDRIWEKRKDKYMERILTQNDKHSPDFLDFDAEKKRLDKLINKARSYSDAEFELHVQDLANELLLEHGVNYEQKWVATKVANLLLNRDMEAVYVAKLDQLKSEKAQLVASGKE